MIKGSNGVFDIVADGQPIFSKHKTGRFPKDDEIIGLLRK